MHPEAAAARLAATIAAAEIIAIHPRLIRDASSSLWSIRRTLCVTDFEVMMAARKH